MIPGGSSPARRAPADLLALSFGVAVAMWAAGYVGRLPGVLAPSGLLLLVFLACITAGGVLAGRLTERGWTGGAAVGLIAGLVNLLVLGSLLGGHEPGRVAPSAAWWVPGSLLVSAALAAAGAALGAGGRGRRFEPAIWAGAFAKVAVGATLLLLAVGGMVTSQGAGLAVVDWPNTYGYNMFLFPLSRMTGGIYFEHAHRLFGALVGLTTLVLAVTLERTEERRWVRGLAWAALALVVIQGVLGGLRVTGRFTLSTSPAEVAPRVTLAVVHGVLGQAFLGTMVALAVFTSAGWRRRAGGTVRPSVRTDRFLCAMLTGLLMAQIAIGAVQRHLASGLLLHVTLAVVVSLVALACGVRAWGLNPLEPRLRRLGHAVMGLTGLQIFLGLLAFLATGPLGTGSAGPSGFEVAATTAHQWCGALLLGCTVMLALWTWGLVRPGEAGAGAPTCT